MNKLFCTVILLSACNSVSAKIYSENEILHFNESSVIGSKQQQVITDYNQSMDTENFLNTLTSSPIDNLQTEYLLNGLLDYLSMQPKSQKHHATVLSLQKYQSQALKVHQEGAINVPIYNINASAKGVENIWFMQELKNTVEHEINTDMHSALELIKLTLIEQHEGKTLGIKNSLKSLSDASVLKLSNYFMAHINKIVGIEKYVIDFAIETNDKLLINKLNMSLPKVNSEYLLRSVVKHYGEQFTIQQLIKHSQSGTSKRFALSLLKPYVDAHKSVQVYLLSALDNKQLSAASAFSLSQSKDQKLIDLLEKKYLLTDSIMVKKNIRFSLKLNSHLSAQKLLGRLDMGEKK